MPNSSSYICESWVENYIMDYNLIINFRRYTLNGYPYQNDVLERHANDVAMEV